MTNSKSIYPVCFWCGRVFDEPVILGDDFTQEQKDAVPEKCVIHYDPCPQCLSEWGPGRVFIEYDEKTTYEHQPCLKRPDGSKFYPTGRRCVVSIEKALALFGKEGEVEQVSFLNKDDFKMVFETDPEISCFWCGEPFDGSKRTVKRLKSIKSYEPCDACKKKWSDACVLFECDYTSDRGIEGVTVICDGKPMYPTGRLMRLDPEEVKRLIGSSEPIIYISKSKFRILSGEDKPESHKAVSATRKIPNSAPSAGLARKPSVLARNDDK